MAVRLERRDEESQEDYLARVKETTGLNLDAMEVGNVRVQTIQHKGVCACGHKVSAHRKARDGRVICAGVPAGRRMVHTRTETDCACTAINPVVVVQDGRAFRSSWLSAEPEHPFTTGLRKVVQSGQTVTWLVPVPVECAVCGGAGDGVRMVYVPGSYRTLSGFACSRCAPVVSG